MTAIPSIPVDKSSSIPIYIQLKNGIINLIRSGDLMPGDSVPSETVLSRHHNISPMTVRQAMTELVNAGRVERIRGRGTFVTEQRLPHPLENLVSFTEDIHSRNMKASSKILLLRPVETPTNLREQLGLGDIRTGTRLKRIRYANDIAVGIHDSYLHGIEITDDSMSDQDSLYQYLEANNIQIGNGYETIEAVTADAETASNLSIATNSPLLKTTRYSWDIDNNFLEYVVALYHADLYQYTVQLRRR